MHQDGPTRQGIGIGTGIGIGIGIDLGIGSGVGVRISIRLSISIRICINKYIVNPNTWTIVGISIIISLCIGI